MKFINDIKKALRKATTQNEAKKWKQFALKLNAELLVERRRNIKLADELEKYKRFAECQSELLATRADQKARNKHEMQYIFRNTHENYTQINNHSAQNNQLSLQAKGLLFVLLSNQDTWRPYLSELEKRSTNGREAHRNAFEELKREGYIRVYRKSLGRGKGVQNYPLVQDVPITDTYWEYWVNALEHELSTGNEAD